MVGKKIIINKTAPVQSKPIQTIPIQSTPVVHEKFNGIIEDFEKKLKYWSNNHSYNTFLNRISLDNVNVGKFEFNATYSREEFHPNINCIFYTRKMDFSKYKGIRFMVKGNSNLFYKIKILEMENYYQRNDVKEKWYKIFKANDKWEKHEILFKEMQVEEYWEQDYISDNIQIFTNIGGISITAQNISTWSTIKGVLYIDNIELY